MKQLTFLSGKTTVFIRKLIFLKFFLYLSIYGNAQCPSEGVALLSQADVDNFAINYPNCTHVEGALLIYGYNSNITDISPLSHLQHIDGGLLIGNTHLTNLSGFSSLETVGALNLSHNSQLTNIGLNSLTTITNHSTDPFASPGIHIYANHQLTSLDGLENVQDVEGEISIGSMANGSEQGNDLLADISALQNINLAGVTYLRIENNPMLSVCNYPVFCEYLAGDGYRAIRENASGCYTTDEVILNCLPTCEPPTQISASNVINDSATISWASEGNLFDVEWGVEGFTRGTGTTQNGISLTSIALTNLSELTSYDIYIRQNCTVNQSEWVKLTFTTLGQCPPGGLFNNDDPDSFVIVLLSQDAVNEFGELYPNCTHIQGSLLIGLLPLFQVTQNDISDLTPLNKIHTIRDVMIISGTQLTTFNQMSSLVSVGFPQIIGNSQLTDIGLSTLSDVSEGIAVSANTQLTNLNGLGNIQNFNGVIRIGGVDDVNQYFQYYRSNPVLTDISALQNISSINITELNIINNPMLAVCDFPIFCEFLSGTGSRAISGNAPGCESVTVVQALCPAPCPKPTDLSAVDITLYTANLNWESDGNSFDIEWGEVGFTQGSGTLISDIETNTYLLESLNYNTQYQFYVRQNCTDQSLESDWAGPFDFSTLEPTCDAPTNLNVTNLTTNSATLNWVSDGNSFEVEWGTYGFIHGSGTLISDLDSNTLDISNLTLNTEYQFYVRQNCELLDSSWMGPFSFTTLNSCPVGGLLLETQAQVDAFAINYPNCTEIVGNLVIQGNDIHDLSALSNITSVTGDATIVLNPMLTSLQGLHNLEIVGGYFDVQFNESLQNLNALMNLTQVQSGEIYIQANTQLTDIMGLSNLDFSNVSLLRIYDNTNLSVCNIENLCTILPTIDSVYIQGNSGECETEDTLLLACQNPITFCPSGDLTFTTQAELDAFAIAYPFCTEISGNLEIYDQDITDLSPLTNIVSINGNLSVNSTGLTSLTGLNSLTTIGGELFVQSNDLLTSLFTSSDINSVEGLFIAFNPLLQNLAGLNSINETNYLYIEQNHSLTNLAELSGLNTIHGGIDIIDNDGLINLNGLNNLTSIDGFIFIFDNDQLSDISALKNIDYATIIDLFILDNPLLFVCDLPNFCQYIAEGGYIEISNNAGDCVSLDAVVEACNRIIWTTEGAWTNIVGPSIDVDAFIEGNLELTENLFANNLYIRNGGSLVVSSDFKLELAGNLINESTPESVTIANNANFIQLDANAQNEGEITVIRHSEDMVRLDYSIWSSPVSGQIIQSFSPDTMPDRIYTYENGNYVVVENPSTTEMAIAQGYMFRAPNTWWNHQTQQPLPAQPYVGKFIGAVNNGAYSIGINSGSYSTIGNPYPSNVDAALLLDLNPGLDAFYFWTNRFGTDNGTYTENNFVAFNSMGSSNGTLVNEVITVGQGFIVKSTNASSAHFNNDLRTTTTGEFLKNNSTERHRFWLNLANDDQHVFNQILIGYMTGATENIDTQIDGQLFGYDGPAIYSVIQDESFVIQGRSIPFEATDVVPLGFKADDSKNFTIALTEMDGLFADGIVSIYINDKNLNTIHNLMESAYAFEAVEGIHNDRFEIIYQTEGEMGVQDLTGSEILIYTQNKNIIIDAKNDKIVSVDLVDLQGRNLYSQSKINAQKHEISGALYDAQVIIVKVETANGKIVSKKVILN